MRALLDTNIILRYAVRADPRYRMIRAALRSMVGAGWELCVATQNIAEFWVVATRPIDVNGLGLSPHLARARVDRVLGAYTLLADPPDLVARWLDLCTQRAVIGRAAHDARLVALMLSHGISHLVTLNATDFARYPEIACLVPPKV